MSRGTRRLFIGLGAALLLILLFGRAVAVFTTEALWFGSVGHADVFWTRFAGSVAVRSAVALAGALVVLGNLWRVVRSMGPVHVRRRYGNLEIAERVPRKWVLTGVTAAALLTGWWIASVTFSTDRTLAVLAWLQAPAWGVADPLFGHDNSFYVFGLPLWTALLDYLLLIVGWSAALVAAGYVVVGGVALQGNRLAVDPGAREHFAWLGAAFLVLLGVRWWLGRYLVLLDGSGFGGGVGYTDVHARLPGHAILAGVAVATAAALVWSARRSRPWVAVAAMVALVACGAGVGVAWPWLVQRYRVEPNQLALESPYVGWRIAATRAAYGLDGLQRREWDPRTAGPLDANAAAAALDGLPLWDAAPLRTALNELQTLYGYYTFPDVAFDRYPSADGPVQVAMAVREFRAGGLPLDARTWRSLHLNPEYRRGWGAVATAAAHTAQGEPDFWLNSLDPVRLDADAPEALALADPRVYFGLTMGGYVLVDAASDTAYTDSVAPPRTRPILAGPEPGGVAIGSFFRRLLFALREGETNLLFTGELTEESRIVLRRGVVDRVQALAPFVLWSGMGSAAAGGSFGAPYPVVHEGRIAWIVDGFTVSAWYPVAAPYDIQGVGRVRYLRHTAKAVVDAVTGDVAFYAMVDDDPVLEAYRGVFPGLFQPASALPRTLAAHLRYPPAFIHAQAEILDEYHLDDPAAFFAGQDFWQLPGGGTPGVAAYRPIQMLSRLPGGAEREFLVVVPFIARERQNMTAVLVGRSDPGVYGELVLLELPRDERIKGPEQIQTIIEQDPEISEQLTLWRGGGSEVEDGELRIVPVGNRILYVQPLFLRAQGSPIPQLQRVVVSDGTEVAMGLTMPLALAALAREGSGAGGAGDAAADASPGSVPRPDPSAGGEPWAGQALELLEAADARLRAGDFAGFGARWNELQELLRALAAGRREGG